MKVETPIVATQLVLRTSAEGAVNGAPFTTAPSVHLADDAGNTVPIANEPVRLTVSAGATVTGTSAVNAFHGVASFPSVGLTGVPGTYTLTYSADLVAGTRTVTQAITLVPGPPSRYNVSASSPSVTVGTSVTINAQLVDWSGAPISTAGTIVTWTSSRTGGYFASPTSTTNASGVAAVSYTVDTLDGKATIRATDNNSIAGTTEVSGIAGPAAKLAFNVSPSAAGWRSIINPAVSVTVQDRYSNTVVAGSPAVTLSLGGGSSGATLTGGGSTPAVGGIATFPGVIVDPPGAGYSLTAFSPGLTGATSPQFEVQDIGVLYQASSSRSLTVSGGSVYFTSCSGGITDSYTCSIATVPNTGALAATVIDGPWSIGNFGGRLLANGVFIDLLTSSQYPPTPATSSAGVRRINSGGGTHQNLSLTGACATTTIESNRGPDLEFDGTSFYMNFVNSSDGDGSVGILRLRAADGACQVLLATPPYSPPPVWPLFTVGGGQLYYADTSGASGRVIKRMSVDGGPSSIVVTEVGVMASGYPWRQMLAVGDTIYMLQEGGLLRSAPISGGVPTTRATDVTGPLVSDGTFLYANGNGQLVRFRLSDFTMVVIADHEVATDLALDSEALYWINQNHIVKKTRK